MNSILKINDLLICRPYIALDGYAKGRKVWLYAIDTNNGYFELDEFGWSIKPNKLSRFATMNGKITLLDVEK